MNQRLKRCLLIFLDLFFVALLFLTVGALVTDYLSSVQPFYIIYMYMQFLALYLTFRLKHMNARVDINVVYRFHLFNFLFSLFTVVTGYLELVKSINGEGMLKANPGFFGLHLFSLVCAHVVIAVYICCPQFSLRDRFSVSGRNNQNRQGEGATEALLIGDPRTHFIAFEQLQLQDKTFNSSQQPNDKQSDDNTCSICLEDFQTGQSIKSLPICQHLFHEPCLRSWYESALKDTCPICRRKFSNRNIDNTANSSQITEQIQTQEDIENRPIQRYMEQNNEEIQEDRDSNISESLQIQRQRRNTIITSSRGHPIIIPSVYNHSYSINQ